MNPLKTGMGIGSFMHIAGRLALQTPLGAAFPKGGAGIAPNPDILRFHGCDVVVRRLSEDGFEAELATPLVEGALVRLRLPGAGALLARVVSSASGRFCAEFINPVSQARLGKTLGLSAYTPQAA